MNTEIIMLVLSLLYGIPSFVLYVVILIQLIRPKHHKRFSNPFFRLCFLIGIVDCIGYLNFYFFVRLPTYAFLSFVYTSPLFNSSPLTTAMYFLIYFCSNLQLFGNCFLTFNRFTSITITGVHQVLIYMYKENRAFVLALYTLTPWLSDFKYLSPPWVLLVVSTAVRESVTQMFPKRMPSLPSYSTASPLFTRG
ncbi:hypothetical protein QR680_008507 [Steinernema hermaphroditum]|uniref:Serpentine receptor class gamma n=1 Tax=Steinernema hermaphroditum TaxID=289476 RepID=A0AA39IGV8_9BILA|nr:hypothetical protein QR680_008507 [Steinernema hermaphroditum]